MPLLPTDLLHCRQCGRAKPSSAFAARHPNSAFPGHQDECRKCHSKLNKEHYANNKAYYAEKAARSRAARVPALRVIAQEAMPRVCRDCPTPIDLANCRRLPKPGVRISRIGVATMTLCGWSAVRIVTEIDHSDFFCVRCYNARRRAAEEARYKRKTPSPRHNIPSQPAKAA